MTKVRVSNLVTWVLFLLSLLLLRWDTAQLHHLLVAFLVLPGLVISILFAVRNRRGLHYAALGMSVLTVIAYLGWWSIEVLDRYFLDSATGLLLNIWIQFQIPRALFSQRIAQGDLFGALYEGYWQAGMLLLQLTMLFVLARSLRPAHTPIA